MDRWVVAGVVPGGGARFALSTHKDATSSVGTRSAPPPSASPTSRAGSTEARFRVAGAGTATLLIDAPLEEIKGRWTRFRGEFSLDASDLSKSHGQVDLDLDDFTTETFGRKDEDEAQTEHAHNWLEIGADAKGRDESRWARSTFKSLGSVTPAKLAEAPEQSGTRTLKVLAKGDMWLHG